jgi:hypothetical protein
MFQTIVLTSTCTAPSNVLTRTMTTTGIRSSLAHPDGCQIGSSPGPKHRVEVESRPDACWGLLEPASAPEPPFLTGPHESAPV